MNCGGEIMFHLNRLMPTETPTGKATHSVRPSVRGVRRTHPQKVSLLDFISAPREEPKLLPRWTLPVALEQPGLANLVGRGLQTVGRGLLAQPDLVQLGV